MQIERVLHCGCVAKMSKVKLPYHRTLFFDQEILLLKISLKAFCSTKTTVAIKSKEPLKVACRSTLNFK
jgi:hypothetical protein